ncbi:MAG: hypothetical protein ABH952_08205 [Candidatus Omnitrophota bacterium]
MKNGFLLILILFLCYNSIYAAEEKAAPSMGLSVQPGGLLIQQVKLGETYDLEEKSGITLLIENKDDLPHTYKITTFKPSAVGNKKWLKGYLEIPDPAWFWFDKDEVTVPPQSREKVRMYFKIPQEEKYYNQHWTISLGIAGSAEKGEMLTLAVYPRYQLETESQSGLQETPDGTCGIVPSTVIFKDLTSGTKQKNIVTIYNNDHNVHKYKITSQIIAVDKSREQIVPSPGYSWIPEITWLKTNKRTLKIKPGKRAELIVTINIPKKSIDVNKKWEALIFIEPDEGRARFMRIKLE